MARALLAGVASFAALTATSCGAWDQAAAESWSSPPCPSTPTLLADVTAHLEAGGLATLQRALATEGVSDDLRTLWRAAVSAASPDATSTDAANVRARVDALPPQTAAGLSAAATVLAALTTPPTSTAARLAPRHPGHEAATDAPLWGGGAAGLRALLGCIDADALRAGATVLRDPRAAATLSALASAVARDHAAKSAELAEVALEQPAAFGALAETLLRNLADPAFDPTTLLDLLAGLSTGEDGLIAALGDAVGLLVTAPDGTVAPGRRAATAKLLTCGRQADSDQALPALLYALLARTHLPAAPESAAESGATSNRGATSRSAKGAVARSDALAAGLAASADTLERLADDADALAAVGHLTAALLAPDTGPQLLRELHHLVSPPLQDAWVALVDAWRQAGDCAP